MEIGTWADWASAVTAGLGIVISYFALSYAREANRTAEVTRQESRDAADKALGLDEQRAHREDERDDRTRALEGEMREREAERDLREAERDRRSVAGSLTAWWVTNNERSWGVLVSNTGASTVFHEVEITTRGNVHSPTIFIRTVPPGRFYCQSGHQGWGYPQPVADTEQWNPVMNAGKTHSVDCIKFTDQLGSRWEWTAGAGLTQVENARTR